MSAPAIVARRVTKRFGTVTAVEQLDLTVASGETVVLWGPNGAGKTTVLRCLLGIVPFEGAITVAGHDVRTDGKAARRQLGYVPQEIRLHGEPTVREAARFYARLRRVPDDRADALLERWQLREAGRRPVRGLSGGMKQKLALVIALLADPPILLLDEPTSNLDVQARRDFSTLLEQLKRDGKTLVCCLHQLGDVWKLADRMVVLAQGRMVSDGPPADVAGTLPETTIVCVTVARERTQDAAMLLEQHGWSVQRNGMQLWVSVPTGRRVEPVTRLVAAGIRILDIEWESAIWNGGS